MLPAASMSAVGAGCSSIARRWRASNSSRAVGPWFIESPPVSTAQPCPRSQLRQRSRYGLALTEAAGRRLFLQGIFTHSEFSAGQWIFRRVRLCAERHLLNHLGFCIGRLNRADARTAIDSHGVFGFDHRPVVTLVPGTARVAVTLGHIEIDAGE